jgi:hypothetical protein
MQNAIDDDDSDPRAQAITDLASIIEQDHDDAMADLAGVTGVFRDLLAGSLGRVNWHEIAQHYVDDVTLYSAGWNTPGYMPDTPAALFIDAGDAMEHVRDAALDYFDSDEDFTDESVRDGIKGWKTDGKGEFGQSLGSNHYFVTRT